MRDRVRVTLTLAPGAVPVEDMAVVRELLQRHARRYGWTVESMEPLPPDDPEAWCGWVRTWSGWVRTCTAVTEALCRKLLMDDPDAAGLLKAVLRRGEVPA